MNTTFTKTRYFALTLLTGTLLGFSAGVYPLLKYFRSENLEREINRAPQFELITETWGNNSLPVFIDEHPKSLNAYVSWKNEEDTNTFQMGYLNVHQDRANNKMFTLPEQYLQNINRAWIYAIDKYGLSSDTIPIYQCDFDGKWYEKNCVERSKSIDESLSSWEGF